MERKFLDYSGLRSYDIKIKNWIENRIEQSSQEVMHFKTSVSSASDLPQNPAIGDVYISTSNFTYSGETIEPGDLFVRAEEGWTIIQGNLTLDSVSENEINELFGL